jgi:hypothetical protein
MRPQSAAEKIRKDAARLMEAADKRAEIRAPSGSGGASAENGRSFFFPELTLTLRQAVCSP